MNAEEVMRKTLNWPCGDCKCHISHSPKAEWDGDINTDCIMSRDTDRDVPCDDFERDTFLDECTALVGKVNEGFDRFKTLHDAIVSDSCEMARAAIAVCPGDLFCSEKGVHDGAYNCEACFKLDEKTCPARKWLERCGQPDAWRVE